MAQQELSSEVTADTVRKKKRLKMTVKKGGTQYEQYVGISEHL